MGKSAKRLRVDPLSGDGEHAEAFTERGKSSDELRWACPQYTTTPTPVFQLVRIVGSAS